MKTVDNTELNCSIQTITIDDDIFFRAKDIAIALWYSNTNKAINDHVRTAYKDNLGTIIKDKDLTKHYPLTYNESQTIYINELGLYSLAMNSKLPAATAFQDWVYGILKEIRRTGTYSINNNILDFKSENELHWRFIAYFKQMYPDKVKYIHAGLGELQDTSWKRIDAYRKGYVKGKSDFVLGLKNKNYDGLAIEFKTRMGKALFHTSRRNIWRRWTCLIIKLLLCLIMMRLLNYLMIT